jgi:hypothetical protein
VENVNETRTVIQRPKKNVYLNIDIGTKTNLFYGARDENAYEEVIYAEVIDKLDSSPRRPGADVANPKPQEVQQSGPISAEILQAAMKRLNKTDINRVSSGGFPRKGEMSKVSTFAVTPSALSSAREALVKKEAEPKPMIKDVQYSGPISPTVLRSALKGLKKKDRDRLDDMSKRKPPPVPMRVDSLYASQGPTQQSIVDARMKLKPVKKPMWTFPEGEVDEIFKMDM